MTRGNGHYLTLHGRPYCDHLGCQAGQSLARDSGVRYCSYITRADAIKARKTLLAHGYSAVIHSGVCPSML